MKYKSVIVIGFTALSLFTGCSSNGDNKNEIVTELPPNEEISQPTENSVLEEKEAVEEPSETDHIDTVEEEIEEILYTTFFNVTYEYKLNPYEIAAKVMKSESTCHIYIDDEIGYENIEIDSLASFSLDLSPGEHTIAVKTINWGLISGSRSDEFTFIIEEDQQVLNLNMRKKDLLESTDAYVFLIEFQ